MKQKAFGTTSVREEEQRTALHRPPVEQSTPASLSLEAACEALSVPQLAALSQVELDNYRRGEPYTDAYGVELVRRATVQADQEAWAWMQRCFSGFVLGWLYRHPSRETACRLESEEDYVAQAFERFWQATTLTRRLEFHSLAAVLQYLRMSLNAAIVDTLRTYARSSEVSLPEPGDPGEPYMEDVTCGSEVWEILQTMLPGGREQRLAYLLFHCGLKPREIVRFCPQQFSNIREIYHLRRCIMERLLRNADQL
ncbi:MAG TPA: hypothetical protein VF844_00410 [Ktedonobacteraceae bacterium]